MTDPGGYQAWPPPEAAGAPGADALSGAARAWGAVSLAFGALVLVGSAIPWFAGSSFAVTDHMGSAWPLVVVGLIGVLGGVDGLRGRLAGPALAAGAGSVFVLVQVVMVRVLDQLPGARIGGGGVAWTLAAVAAVVLVVAVLALAGRDRAQGPTPGWLGAVVLVAGGVWVAGMLVPPSPGLSFGDHVEDVLFGGDTFSDVVTAAFIGVPAAFVVLAAATRTRVAHGLAAGSMAYWAVATVTAAGGDAWTGDGTVRYAVGSFWPVLLGASGAAIAGCVALVMPSRGAPAPAPGARPAEGWRLVPLAPVVGLALLPVAGLVGATQHAEDGDAFGVAAPSGAAYGPFDADGTPVDADANANGAGVGGSLDVVCTDLVDSAVESAWQDVDGAIHVIVLVDNGCDVGQQLDDPSAAFTLTSGGATVADATFDFSSDPVVVPASGTSEAEIVFGPETFVDLEVVETLGLGADTAVGPGSLGLTYSYSCTDAPDGAAGSDGTAVAGRATSAPVDPQTTSEGDALDRLAEIARADEPFVESDVIDRWVPQISSKKPDVTLPDGTVWDAVSILDDHRAWRARFPRVRLLWSGNHSTFDLADYWVTIVAVPFDTPEGALGWCTAEALPGEDCYAKLISHTHPAEDSTRHR